MLSSVCEVTILAGLAAFHLRGFPGAFNRRSSWHLRAVDALWAKSLGVTALGNLMLSRRDSLLLDVQSTVPAEKVTRLRYADLPVNFR